MPRKPRASLAGAKKPRKRTKKARNAESNAAKLEVTETEVRDEKGNVERHDVVVQEQLCDYVAGDYMPGNKECDVCAVKSLCILNAIELGRIARNDTNQVVVQKEEEDWVLRPVRRRRKKKKKRG